MNFSYKGNTYFVGSYSSVLCIIIACILSSSDPFIREMSWFMFSVAGFCGALSAELWAISQDFLFWLLMGMRATIKLVFFGIKHWSSLYSSFVWAFEIWSRKKAEKILKNLSMLQNISASNHALPINRSRRTFRAAFGAESPSLDRRPKCGGRRNPHNCSLIHYWIWNIQTFSRWIFKAMKNAEGYQRF